MIGPLQRCVAAWMAAFVLTASIGLLPAGAATAATAAEETVTVILNGETVEFADQQPVIIDDRTLVPMRAILEQLGAKVDWDEETKTVSVVKDDIALSLTIGNKTVLKNGAPVDLDVAPQQIGDRTMVPLRFVSEALGAKVEWIEASRTVLISTRPEENLTPEQINDAKFAALPKKPNALSDRPLQDARILAGDAMTVKTVGVDDKNLPFDEALHVTTVKKPELVYSIQVIMDIQAAVKKNDVLMAVFYARGIESDNAMDGPQVDVVVERNGAPNTKSLKFGTPLPEEDGWKKYYLAFQSAEDYEPGQQALKIRVGYEPQTIELAAPAVYHYGTKAALADMPAVTVNYRGRSEDAQWRKDALARIEKIRKSDFEVVVTDESGAPVSGAQVDVRQTKSAFGFGTAVANARINRPAGPNVKYIENLQKYFNMVVPENGLKWPSWENDRQSALDAVESLRNMGFDVRGHNMVWDNFDLFLPKDLAGLKDSPDALHRRTMEHIDEIGTAFRGQLVDWDVINEPNVNHSMADILGVGEVKSWFEAARRADPEAKLYVNEAGIEDPKSQALEKFIGILERYQKAGVKFDGIGVQGHIKSPVNPESFLQTLDRLGEYADELKITEYSFCTTDEAVKADYTRDILIAAYSHPSVGGLLMWGFWDGAHYNKDAPLFYSDWTIKPAGEVYEQIVLRQFRTAEGGKSDTAGKFVGRGYHGDYVVSVTYQGREYEAAMSLEAGKSGTAKVVVPAR